MRRTSLFQFALIVAVAIAVISTFELKQPRASASGGPQGEQWEYLVVAGGTVNLNPSENATMRKAPGAFSRENFPLEQNLDKLGAKGWELVTVTGSPADPVFYFKRRK
jgi:hypothetical protein